MGDSILNAAAGAAGGIVAMTATYPLIFLSTRAAVETKNESKSTYQAVIDIVKREGLSGLYSGLNSSLLGIAITNGVYYYFYEGSRQSILKARGGRKALSTAESMLSGLIAGSATTILSNPVWVIQTEQARSFAVRIWVLTLHLATYTMNNAVDDTEMRQRPGLITVARQLIEKEGLRALWRGVGPALILVMNPIIQYTVFEQLKNVLIGSRTRRLRAAGARSAVAVLSDRDYFLLGAISKLLATGSTYPYIVVKARLQAGSAEARKYKSSMDGLLTILRQEGASGLYKGVGTKLLQSVLTSAILFAAQRRIFEITKQIVSQAAQNK